MLKPRVFWLHVNAFDEPRQRVWAVQTGGQYLTAADVLCNVPVESVFRGRTARQPRAYLRGKGVVEQFGGLIVISEGR